MAGRRVFAFLLCGALTALAAASGAAFAASALDGSISAAKFFPGSIMPNAERRRLAARVLGDKWLRDPEFDDYFARANALLAADDDYLIAVADTDEINAFAHYGGLIVIYRGLFRLAKTEDEFLSVLAHEMGHVKLEHFQKQRDNAERASALSLPILIAGLMVDEPQVRDALIFGSGGLFSGNVYAYSRELEHEADVFGLDAMLTAERNGQAMASVFARLGGSDNEYISTHPAPLRRNAYLANRLHGVPPPPPSPDVSYYLLREKLSPKKVLARDAEKARRRVLESPESSPRELLTARYGLLLLATKTRNDGLGEEMIAALAGEGHPYVIRAMAEELTRRGEFRKASGMLSSALRAHPQNPALAMELLRTMERGGAHRQALQFYDRLPKGMRERPDIALQAGRAAAHLGRRVLSNRLLALGHANNGYFEQALRQIEVAEKFKDGDIDTLTALNELKKRVEKELKLLRNKEIGAE